MMEYLLFKISIGAFVFKMEVYSLFEMMEYLSKVMEYLPFRMMEYSCLKWWFI